MIDAEGSPDKDLRKGQLAGFLEIQGLQNLMQDIRRVPRDGGAFRQRVGEHLHHAGQFRLLRVLIGAFAAKTVVEIIAASQVNTYGMPRRRDRQKQIRQIRCRE